MVVKKKARSKKSLTRHINSYNFFIILSVLLGMFAGVLLVRVLYQGERLQLKETSINLGMFNYEVKGDKALKRDDQLSEGLRASLLSDAIVGCDLNTGPAGTYNVVAFSADRHQALVGYGCGSTDARLFAVYEEQNQTWKLLSPTNQFDTFYIPRCEYVQSNAISPEIAPVCYDQNDGQPHAYRSR